jgi:RNA polymerase sigma-70 factor (ECF subfamily)
MAPGDDEFEWITRAQQGDRGAFTELVRRHRGGIVSLVYRLCGDMNLSEDVAQETFIRAWRHLPGYRPRSAFRNWLYRIATNLAFDALRRYRETVDIQEVSLAAPDPAPEAKLEARERGEQVRRAVLALPPASRAALVLREYEGLSYREIAEALDIPVGTVMSRLSFARERLRQALAPYLEVI